MKYLKLLLKANYSVTMVCKIVFFQSYFLYKSAYGKISAKQCMQSIFSIASNFNTMVILFKEVILK